MWQNRDGKNYIENKNILTLVNEELGNYNRPSMTSEELKQILTNLENMMCIKKSKTNANKGWLREWIRVKYN